MSSESIQPYRGSEIKRKVGGVWLSRDHLSRFAGLMGAPKLWSPTPIRVAVPVVAKTPEVKVKVKQLPPAPVITECFQGCGQVFASRNEAGRHGRWCRTGEGAD